MRLGSLSVLGRSGPLALRALAVLYCLAAPVAPSLAADRAQIVATSEQGHGRFVLTFPDRLDLPGYRISFENNVLAIVFDEPVATQLPDIGAILPSYVTIGRIDPDARGVRFGMRQPFTVHSMEAAEQLFIDLLPATWQGLPPSLPQSVIAALAERARNAAIVAEQKRKADEARALGPVASVRVGKNPTFVRLEVQWTESAEARFIQTGASASLQFDWPVPIDLYALKADLPKEIIGVSNVVSPAGSSIDFTLAEGVAPRFYVEDPKRFTLDFDLTSEEARRIRAEAQTAMQEAEAAAAVAREQAAAQRAALNAEAGTVADAEDYVPGMAITPAIEENSGTVRVKFPFDRDIASAVFRRGDTLWLLFDTRIAINNPVPSLALESIAKGFTIVPSGDTQLVRIDLATQRLATLGSEGRSWVLSVGDVLLDKTDPITLRRSRDGDGRFKMTADLGSPYKVHTFRDPVVGDLLDIVTVFPPAKGLERDLAYVDFDALSSIHGLVIRPESADLNLSIDKKIANIDAPRGLILSDQDLRRSLDSGNATQFRDSYVDFAGLTEADPAAFAERVEMLSTLAAEKEGRAREVARLNLAQFYVGNQFAQEALGVLRVLEASLKSEELLKKVKLTEAIASVLAHRPGDALAVLNSPGFADETDALMWRSIARVAARDYVGARADALVAEAVVESYPVWIQQRFLFAAIRAAVEAADITTAQRLLSEISFADLEPGQVSEYQLLLGRVAEAQGYYDQALEAYGQVIEAEVRPTRAEAVYRTLVVLRDTERVDLAKATETLAAEAMLWRGDPLETDMEKLLAELYFADRQYRLGFEVTRDAASHSPNSKPVEELIKFAEAQFADLYLNGVADQLPDLDALSLFYDFRQMTPAGTRGDEMIRNLARRLVKVDLLGQAADLLEYQITSRLEGAARAQVAADLALIRLAERNPEGALRALNTTRVANLAPSLDRQRRILEARALIDAGRENLALDLLARLEGADVDLLRVDGYWRARNYSAAAGMIENVYSDDPDLQGQLARLNVLKAAVGLVFVNDTIGLNRLRTKFAAGMATAAEWPLFDYITRPDASPTGMEFKAAARLVADVDTLKQFLDAYRRLYRPESGLVPGAPIKSASI